MSISFSNKFFTGGNSNSNNGSGKSKPAYRTLHVMSHGESATGKTRLALSMPRSVGVLPLERNSRESLIDMLRYDHDPDNALLIPNINLMTADLPSHVLDNDEFEAEHQRLRTEAEAKAKAGAKPAYPDKVVLRRSMEEEALRQYYIDHIDNLKSVGRAIARQPGVKSVLIDPGTLLYDAFCISVLGRRPRFGDKGTDMSPIHTDMGLFMQNFANVNVLVTHQSKAEFKGATPTGNFISDGWKRLSYMTTVDLEHVQVKDDVTKQMVKLQYGRKDVKLGDYVCLIKKAHANTALTRVRDGRGVMVNWEINWAQLLLRIYPDMEMSEFVDYWGYTDEELNRWLVNAEEYYEAERA